MNDMLTRAEVVEQSFATLGIDPRDKVNILSAGKQLANNLYVQGSTALENYVIAGEHQAYIAYIGAIVARGNLLLVSEPGAGKTTLLDHGFKLIDGIDEARVAFLEARSDMTPGELVGKSQSMVTRETDHRGNETVTRSTAEFDDPRIHPGLQILNADEVNRNNPRTLNSVLHVTGSRKLETNGGKVEMPHLEIVVLAQNPTESLQTTSHGSSAQSARQAWAVRLADESVWDDILDPIIDYEMEPQPEMIEPAITLPELHVAQVAVDHVLLSSEAKHYVKSAAKATVLTLRDSEMGIFEAPPRIAKQIRHTASTLALMDGRDEVNQRDIDAAISQKMTASLAGNGVPSLGEIKPYIEQAIDKIQ